MKRSLGVLILFSLLFWSYNAFSETYYFPSKDGFIYEDKYLRSKVVGEFKKGEQFIFDTYTADFGWSRLYDLTGLFLGFVPVPGNLEVIHGNDPEDAKKLYKIREDLIKTYSKNIQDLIRAGKLQIGMTKEQVILSWGKPKDIHQTVGKWGVHEQWVYSNNVYLYFENGILTTYQD